VTFVGYPQCLRVELVKDVYQATELGGLFLGAWLEGLNGTSNDLTGRYAECARLGVERSPLLRGHQNHQPGGCCHA
jgi:hypothetical protein